MGLEMCGEMCMVGGGGETNLLNRWRLRVLLGWRMPRHLMGFFGWHYVLEGLMIILSEAVWPGVNCG